MHFRLLLLLLTVFVAESAMAQTTPIYNATSSSQNTTIYNSSSNTNTARPLSIKGLVRKSKNGISQSSYRSQGPYDFSRPSSGGSGSALSMTPAQIRAKQADDAARAQARAEKARQVRRDQQAALKSSRSEERTREFKSRFQDSEEVGVEAEEDDLPVVRPKRSRKPIYVRDSGGLIMPERVFNSLN